MANDREVLRIIWEGQIPVCFQADLDEANAVRQPENFYLMISRLSYLPLVTDKVEIEFDIFWLSMIMVSFIQYNNRLKSIFLDMFQMMSKKVKFGLTAMAHH